MIGSAIERGSLICAFDEHGMTLFSKAKGSGPNDGLLGFSGSTVTVRFGSTIYTYDEKGMTLCNATCCKGASWFDRPRSLVLTRTGGGDHPRPLDPNNRLIAGSPRTDGTHRRNCLISSRNAQHSRHVVAPSATTTAVIVAVEKQMAECRSQFPGDHASAALPSSLVIRPASI